MDIISLLQQAGFEVKGDDQASSKVMAGTSTKDTRFGKTYLNSFWIFTSRSGYQALITVSGLVLEDTTPKGIVNKVAAHYKEKGFLPA